jgi:hypothetical protein
MATDRHEILTKDDVPLWELGETSMEMLDVFNEEASRGFVDMFSREVDSRTFVTRTGDLDWEEVAELEHARTGSIEDYQMAFSVDTYARSLGMNREFVEDSPRDFIEEHIADVVEGGRQKMFDVTFDVLRNGIADGSELWYQPEDHGAYSFDRTHDHVYTGLNNNASDTSNVLFDDTSSHEPTEIVRELAGELTHHGYKPDALITTKEMADYFVEERTEGFGSQFHVPQAESLEENPTDRPMEVVTVNGSAVMQTAWLKPDSNGDHPLYLYDTSVDPVYTNTVRPMEFTDNSGAPVGGAGGFRGDPGALLGAYGTMRFGSKFQDPLAGVELTVTDSEVTTS